MILICILSLEKKNEYNSFSDVCESFWQIIETEGGLGDSQHKGMSFPLLDCNSLG